MAGPRAKSSKQPRHLYKELEKAGIDKKNAAAMARESIPKRRVPAEARPNDEQVREKGV